jgi:Fe-S-cluster containining protein
MEKNLNIIKEKAQLKEKENENFRMFLKGYDHHQVDKIVHQLNQKYLEEFDCTQCGNCCKKLTPCLGLDEIKDIAKHFNLSYENFKNKYIEKEMAEGFTFKGQECPFLKDNNKCHIYYYRPEVCRSYPHLHKDNINYRLLNIIDNTYICPIVYNVFEELKQKLWKDEDII